LIDWEDIKLKVEGSSTSIRAIAREHDISDTTIRKKIKKEEWVRYVPTVQGRKKEVQSHKNILGQIALRKLYELKEELGENYNPVDEPLIVMYAKNYERYIELEIEMADEGVVAMSAKTGATYINPVFNALQMVIKNLAVLGDKLGLSIESRKKLNLQLGKKAETPSLFDIVSGFNDMEIEI